MPVLYRGANVGHPLDAWVKMMGDRLDHALSQVNQAYLDAKLAGTNVDAVERRDRDQRRKADPAGLAEPVIAFVHAPDALHRTHIKAMDVYGSLAAAMASRGRAHPVGRLWV